jgi:hypothetical protein
MVKDRAAWMDEKGYKDLESFRRKMNKKDPWIYSRAQYVRLLTNPSKIMEQISKV